MKKSIIVALMIFCAGCSDPDRVKLYKAATLDIEAIDGQVEKKWVETFRGDVDGQNALVGQTYNCMSIRKANGTETYEGVPDDVFNAVQKGKSSRESSCSQCE